MEGQQLARNGRLINTDAFALEAAHPPAGSWCLMVASHVVKPTCLSSATSKLDHRTNKMMGTLDPLRDALDRRARRGSFLWCETSGSETRCRMYGGGTQRLKCEMAGLQTSCAGVVTSHLTDRMEVGSAIVRCIACSCTCGARPCGIALFVAVRVLGVDSLEAWDHLSGRVLWCCCLLGCSQLCRGYRIRQDSRTSSFGTLSCVCVCVWCVSTQRWLCGRRTARSDALEELDLSGNDFEESHRSST